MVLEPVLRDFPVAHPGVTYNIRVAGTEETVRCIVEDMAHIGLFQPPNDARLRSHYSRLSPIRVHVRKDHPLARRRKALSLSDAAHQGAALVESFGVRKHVQAAELDEQVTLKPMLVTNSFKVLWEFAALGLGYIMTPRSIPLQGAQFRTLPLTIEPQPDPCGHRAPARGGRWRAGYVWLAGSCVLRFGRIDLSPARRGRAPSCPWTWAMAAVKSRRNSPICAAYGGACSNVAMSSGVLPISGIRRNGCSRKLLLTVASTSLSEASMSSPGASRAARATGLPTISKRETIQSMAFLRPPGMARTYSGLEMMSPSARATRSGTWRLRAGHVARSPGKDRQPVEMVKDRELDAGRRERLHRLQHGGIGGGLAGAAGDG